MEWLKDKKNLPVVAGLGVLVLVLALAAILFETGVIGGGAQTAPVDTTAAAPSPPPASAPGDAPQPGAAGAPAPGQPAAPGQPGAQAAKPTVKGPGNVAKGPDPFSVPGLKAPATSRKVAQQPKIPINAIVPPISISNVPPPNSLLNTSSSTNSPAPTAISIPNIRLTPEESQSMRVSGVVLTNGSGVRAVLEANGQSLTVQPGDAVPGGRVISIQSDGLTMKADDGSVIHVPIGNGNSGTPQGG